MGAIRVRKDTKKLILDFTYQGTRYRENTVFSDTKANRLKLKKLLNRIETEISDGNFDYLKYFPNGSRVKLQKTAAVTTALSDQSYSRGFDPSDTTPDFNDFATEWLNENEVSWRKSHACKHAEHCQQILSASIWKYEGRLHHSSGFAEVSVNTRQSTWPKR